MKLSFHKSQSTVRPLEVDTTSSNYVVYIRKNITETVTDNGSMFDYDEAKLTKEEYETYRLEQLNGVVDIDSMTLEEYKEYKKTEIGEVCQNTIFAGCDITLSTGTKHFSLSYDDQLNLLGLSSDVASGAETIRYHADGMDCEYFSNADALTIIQTMMAFKTYHTTYCNQLNMTIMNDCTTKSEVKNIFYGMELSDERDARLVELTGVSSKQSQGDEVTDETTTTE